MLLGDSYDNEPYVSYVRDSAYFGKAFHGLSLSELARLDLDQAGVEGVSGATMTSTAAAEGLVRAAVELQRSRRRRAELAKSGLRFTPRDAGTVLVVVLGLLLAYAPLPLKRAWRLPFQGLLIGYLGLTNGDMVSQAMLAGWAENGAPWRTAFGLVFLTAAALVCPIATRSNAYCTHLCPHGAAQQLLRNRLPRRAAVSSRLRKWLPTLPAVLLGWCVLVAMAGLPFSLVDIEPFDAWLLGVAGWASVTIAVVGLAASLATPMAYCRYGCPTGALLGYLRRHGRSGHWAPRDWFALGLLLLAVGLLAWSWRHLT
jgi:hypothetical protein